jgi:hypothetical protein
LGNSFNNQVTKKIVVLPLSQVLIHFRNFDSYYNQQEEEISIAGSSSVHPFSPLF